MQPFIGCNGELDVPQIECTSINQVFFTLALVFKLVFSCANYYTLGCISFLLKTCTYIYWTLFEKLLLNLLIENKFHFLSNTLFNHCSPFNVIFVISFTNTRNNVLKTWLSRHCQLHIQILLGLN